MYRTCTDPNYTSFVLSPSTSSGQAMRSEVEGRTARSAQILDMRQGLFLLSLFAISRTVRRRPPCRNFAPERGVRPLEDF